MPGLPNRSHGTAPWNSVQEVEETRGEALAAWEERLRQAEDDLLEREREALADDPGLSELLALAAEHDKIALDRDSIAASYDELSGDRDVSALGRDVTGSGRDRRARAVAQDRDAGFTDRWLAGEDRDEAAGGRAESYDDRLRAKLGREQAAVDRTRAADERDRAVEKATDQERELHGLRGALESRMVIGQAQGLLMARHDMSSRTAFATLVRLSQNANVKLRDVAARLVAAADAGGDDAL